MRSPVPRPVIPAKAGIHRHQPRPLLENQARIATSESPSPRSAPVIPAKAGIHRPTKTAARKQSPNRNRRISISPFRAPSFPRKRESANQPRPPLENKPESRPTHPISPFRPRHSRESGNPQTDQDRRLKTNPNRNRRIPSPCSAPVIPAKAGIHRHQPRPPLENQTRIATSESPSPYSAPVIPAKAGIHRHQPRPPLETKPESRPTNPLSLDGRGLG